MQVTSGTTLLMPSNTSCGIGAGGVVEQWSWLGMPPMLHLLTCSWQHWPGVLQATPKCQVFNVWSGLHEIFRTPLQRTRLQLQLLKRVTGILRLCQWIKNQAFLHG